MTAFWQQKHAIREHACRKKAAFICTMWVQWRPRCGILWGHICASNTACDDSKLAAECRYAWHSVTAYSRQYSGSNGIWTAVLRQPGARPRGLPSHCRIFLSLMASSVKIDFIFSVIRTLSRIAYSESVYFSQLLKSGWIFELWHFWKLTISYFPQTYCNQFSVLTFPFTYNFV